MKAIKSGHFQAEIKSNAQKQISAIKMGKRRIIGVNCYQYDETANEKSEDYYYCQQKLVITSYSIHYTKLYESPFPQVSLPNSPG